MTKTVDAYTVYDSDNWPRNLPLQNFTLKDCMFGVTNSDKSGYVCSGYGIAFDGASSWSFDNDFARNAVIFGVDNSLSSHFDNVKNNFLVSGKVLTDNINDSIGAAKEKFSINFSKILLGFALQW